MRSAERERKKQTGANGRSRSQDQGYIARGGGGSSRTSIEWIADLVAAPRPRHDWILTCPGSKSSGLHGLTAEPQIGTGPSTMRSKAGMCARARYTADREPLARKSCRCLAEEMSEQVRVKWGQRAL